LFIIVLEHVFLGLAVWNKRLWSRRRADHAGR